MQTPAHHSDDPEIETANTYIEDRSATTRQATTTHQLTIRALQTTKNKIRPSAPFPISFNRRFTIIRIEKQIYILSSRETIAHRQIATLTLIVMLCYVQFIYRQS